MKIPNKVKVGSFIYSISYDKNVARSGEVYGVTNHKDLTIFLDPEVPRLQIENTLIHEVMHTVFYVSGMSARLREKDEKKPEEEEMVAQLSNVLHQVFQENDFLKTIERSSETFLKSERAKEKINVRKT